MTSIGYARCSTETQDTAGQVAALMEAGCASIFREKESGVVTNRKQLARAISLPTTGGEIAGRGRDRRWQAACF
jgi:DNA invertase Pin-like site-specific DNA recombinase